MARITGVDLPKNKRIEIALTYIYGIGRPRSREMCKSIGLADSLRVHQLTDVDIAKIREYIEKNFPVEGDLRREVH